MPGSSLVFDIFSEDAFYFFHKKSSLSYNVSNKKLVINYSSVWITWLWLDSDKKWNCTDFFHDWLSSNIMCAAFSPIMMQGTLVFPVVSVGMIEASATLNPWTPRTRNLSTSKVQLKLPNESWFIVDRDKRLKLNLKRNPSEKQDWHHNEEMSINLSWYCQL